jgi:multiple sugar transport system permease protein
MNVKARTPLSIFFSVLKYAVLAAGAVMMVLPFADMFIGALRTPAELLARPPVYWPQTPRWNVYSEVFQRLPILPWYVNSVIVTLAITVLQLLTSALAGFALAKYEFRGRNFLFNIVLAAQMFPFFLFLIPLFFLMRYWPLAGGNDLFGQGGTGFLGSYVGLILPFMVTWYGIFLMRQFMIGLPTELMEAARIDGCSEFRIFSQIMLPLLKPAFATLGIFVFIYHWNEFIWTMTISRSAPHLQTLPVGIYLARSVFPNIQDQAFLQAALAISTVPVAILFLVLQRYYVKGMVMSGIKG